MPSRPIWTGSISFGLVNIPIKLHTAVREHRINFHLLHDQDKVRLKRKLICPQDNKEVHPEHTVKGYEIAKDQYVIVHQEELKSCAPKASKTIEITDFVDLASIDPIYFDRPYYVVPDKGADKSYRLLIEAMRKSHKIGIARIVMHEKEYLAALRPIENAICLETMRFSDEVTAVSELGLDEGAKVGERELKVAQQLVDSLATTFDPTQYHDEYRNCIREMIEKKASGQKITAQPPAEKKSAKATDLMAALQASLAHAKGKAPKPRRKSA